MPPAAPTPIVQRDARGHRRVQVRDSSGATLAFFDTRTAQELYLGGKDEYTDAWVTAKDGVSQEDLAQGRPGQAARRLRGRHRERPSPRSRRTRINQALSFINTFLLVFAGIALFVGSFLIINTFSILVAQRSRELALFRALGRGPRR